MPCKFINTESAIIKFKTLPKHDFILSWKSNTGNFTLYNYGLLKFSYKISLQNTFFSIYWKQLTKLGVGNVQPFKSYLELIH